MDKIFNEQTIFMMSQREEPQEIVDNLYLSSVKVFENVEKLKTIGINSIISVGGITASHDDFVNILALEGIEDIEDPSSDLFSHFEQCNNFIKQHLQHGKVLVHCMHGVSRSATIVIAYIMQMMILRYDAAYLFVKEKRPCIKPNKEFIKQLKRFEYKIFIPKEAKFFTLKK